VITGVLEAGMFDPIHFPHSATRITTLRDSDGVTNYERYPADRYFNEPAFIEEYEN
jgi:hypothetical protein